LLALDEYQWYKRWRKSIRVNKNDDDVEDWLIRQIQW
jgi:hypothetical protein